MEDNLRYYYATYARCEHVYFFFRHLENINMTISNQTQEMKSYTTLLSAIANPVVLKVVSFLNLLLIIFFSAFLNSTCVQFKKKIVFFIEYISIVYHQNNHLYLCFVLNNISEYHSENLTCG